MKNTINNRKKMNEVFFEWEAGTHDPKGEGFEEDADAEQAEETV